MDLVVSGHELPCRAGGDRRLHRLRFIDFDEPWPEDYLAINPHRKVPSLIETSTEPAPDTVVYQSAAILLHLADRHPEAEPAPPPGTPPRALCYQWLFFMAEMLQPSYMMFYYPERHTTDPDGRGAVAAKGIEWIAELWGRSDRALENHTYLLGETFSICDLYMLTMALWNESDESFTPLTSFPKVARTVAKLKARLPCSA